MLSTKMRLGWVAIVGVCACGSGSGSSKVEEIPDAGPAAALDVAVPVTMKDAGASGTDGLSVDVAAPAVADASRADVSSGVDAVQAKDTASGSSMDTVPPPVANGWALPTVVDPGLQPVKPCPHKGDGPTDNPVTTRYGDKAYLWTSQIRWDCVYNINSYPGATPLDQFNAARDDAFNAGGGVVYFPAGTYTFKDNLVLKSGVVIRGAVVKGDARTGTSPGTLAPTTKFVFPDRGHKGFFNNGAMSTNIGVVNIDSDGGAIMFWPSLQTDGTGLKGYWWYGTKVNGLGKNKIVLGNRITHVAYSSPDPNLDIQVIWPYRFAAAIGLCSDENALVANNLLDKATRVTNVMLVLDPTAKNAKGFTGMVPFPYDNRYGITVNRFLLGPTADAYAAAGMVQRADLKPDTFPWQFRHGLAIVDNYIYMNGRVGIEWSGDGDGTTQGSGTQVVNNHVEIAANTTLYTVDGLRLSEGSNTNENRGYDQLGFASLVKGNTGHINRQLVVNTPYLSIDGEGIVQQDNHGNAALLNVWTENDLTGGSSGYMKYYWLLNVQNNLITKNKVNSDQDIGVETSGLRARHDQRQRVQ